MSTRVQPPPPREGDGREAPVVERARLDPGGERDRLTWLVIVAVVGLVGLAILKPWEGGPRSGSSAIAPATVPVATHVAAPSVALSADETGAQRCNRPLGWRSYTKAIWRDQQVRSFVAIEPLIGQASSPLDPAIPVVPAYGREVLGIGYCAPVVGDTQPPPGGLTVELWHIGADGRPGRVSTRRSEPQRPSSMVGLFGRRTGELREDRTPRWADGRYIFHLSGPAGSEFSAWFGVEVNPDR